MGDAIGIVEGIGVWDAWRTYIRVRLRRVLSVILRCGGKNPFTADIGMNWYDFSAENPRIHIDDAGFFVYNS